MGVDVQGEGHGGVAQATGDDARVDAAGQGQCGIAVSQVVQANLRQAGDRAQW